MSDNLGDSIWSEIGRLDDEIEKYQVELSICDRHITKLISILKENNIPVPDLETEGISFRKEKLLIELNEFKESLLNLQEDQKLFEINKDKDVSLMDEQEKRNHDLFSYRKDWVAKRFCYLKKNIKKTEDHLVELSNDKENNVSIMN
jgi:hypothetical protein